MLALIFQISRQALTSISTTCSTVWPPVFSLMILSLMPDASCLEKPCGEPGADLGIMLLCCWKGPGVGLPQTLNTGLGLPLPEADARCALSSFT